jgi:hypothetical protein
MLVLMVLGFFFKIPTASAVQNFPHKNGRVTGPISSAALDKLTLTLIDRLPTEPEREFVRSRGAAGAYEFASHLIRTREFFDRLSLYWQSHLTQSPAWLWESSADSRWHRHFLTSDNVEFKPIYFIQLNESRGSETVCSGAWTILRDNKPQMCNCDDTADVIPHWDSSSSMRVCPVAREEENCGPALQKCLPVDARLHSQMRNLHIDRESAGGRAITRMLNDLNLVQSRSIALAIFTQRKWGQITEPASTLLSRSSVDLLKKWSSANNTSPAAAIAQLLRTNEISATARNLFVPPIVAPRGRMARPIAETPAEELLITPQIENKVLMQPLRQTHLTSDVWAWNANLILNCQVPHFSPQLFQLPLPNPEHARDGAYFCTSCHLSLDKFISEHRARKKLAADLRTLGVAVSSNSRTCAVEHALHFLLGYRPSSENQSDLIKFGELYFQQNGEQLGQTIRDLALRIARRGDGE